MKRLTIRLPEGLIADIEQESRLRRLSKSEVIRKRLETNLPVAPAPSFEAIADLVGSVDGLPADLSSRTKHYLKQGYVYRVKRVQ
jgi:hypothetical protein